MIRFTSSNTGINANCSSGESFGVYGTCANAHDVGSRQLSTEIWYQQKSRCCDAGLHGMTRVKTRKNLAKCYVSTELVAHIFTAVNLLNLLRFSKWYRDPRVTVTLRHHKNTPPPSASRSRHARVFVQFNPPPLPPSCVTQLMKGSLRQTNIVHLTGSITVLQSTTHTRTLFLSR